MQDMRFKYRWFMHDLARSRSFHREEFTELLSLLHRCGYNGIALYVEGFFQFPQIPGIPRKGCMTKEDALWARQEAKKYHLSIIPFTNLVGHAESFLCQERFRHLGKNSRQFDMAHPSFHAFALSILDQFIECFEPEYIHIGGDEVALNDEELLLYASFLSDMGRYLKQKGIRTGIFGDMLLSHPQLAKDIDKELIIFDWWYNGHRPESIRMLLNMGFSNLFVCPSTCTYNGIVATQYHCPWRNELPWNSAYPLKEDEIEAFLEDGISSGIQSALITDWENLRGHTLWSGLMAIARAGHYMTGQPLDEESLERTVFGRITPFSGCVRTLASVQSEFIKQAELLPGRMVTHHEGVRGVYIEAFMMKLLLCAGDYMSPELGSRFSLASQTVLSILTSWTPESALEDRARRTLRLSAGYAYMLSQIFGLANEGRTDYHAAAMVQYTHYEEYLRLLRQVAERFSEITAAYGSFAQQEQDAIRDSGHTRTDLQELARMAERFEQITAALSEYLRPEYAQIALPCWESLLQIAFVPVNINT